jgi:hypothetical protein
VSEIGQCWVASAGPVTAAALNLSNPPTPDPLVVVHLTEVNGSFSGVPFIAMNIAKSQILAAALAAISTSSPVTAYYDQPPAAGGASLMCYGLLVKGQ